jgi:arylsulfatase A-like enzyme
MINRRDALRMGLTGSAACAAVAQDAASRIEGTRYLDRKRGRHGFKATGKAKRPHVFLLTADMVSPDHYRGDRPFARHMNLSAIRSLAADSVVFHNAFCASPLCAPARAALLTGRYTYITANGERAHDGHETILRPDDVIFPEYLKAAGYATKHCGKGHLGVPKFIDAFDENVSAWDRWDPPIHRDEGYLTHLRRLRVKPQKFSREIRGLQQDRKTPSNSMGGWIVQSDGAPFPLEASYSIYLAQRALEKVDAALASGGPVYLQLDIFDPHQPFSVPDGFSKREAELRGVCAELPRSYREIQAAGWRLPTDQPKIYDLYRKYWGLYDPAAVADYRVANALQMEVVDRAVGLFLDGLRSRGLYDDSLIVFTADHGEMNGRRAVVDKGVYLYPDVLRVPLSVKMPRGYAVHTRSVEAPVSHLDLAPTLLSLCGIQPEARLDGISLLPAIEQGQPTADRAFLFECGWHVGVNFACAVQDWHANGQHHLYSYNLASATDELFDLRHEDAPNLAADPAHKQTRARMIERLGAVLERDPRWLGYWASFRIDRYFELPLQTGDMQLRV